MLTGIKHLTSIYSSSCGIALHKELGGGGGQTCSSNTQTQIVTSLYPVHVCIFIFLLNQKESCSYKISHNSRILVEYAQELLLQEIQSILVHIIL